MEEVIKNILDEYSKSSSQVNFESDSARAELATYITKQMLNWQAEKHSECFVNHNSNI